MAETHELVIVLLIFLGKLSLTHSKEANVTCIIQDDCILPCSFRPTGTVVIHWYKQQIPVHSYYYNKDQFGLQNKHFSGRTCLFNSQITNGNASLLLRRVKVQDKGRYKCYTSTRKGNHEAFVNLDVKAPIQSVNMEMSDEMVSCSSHNIYPVPQVAWATDPPSAREALQNYTIKTTDHKGLFTVESTLRILGNLSDYAYFCSFISADKTQVWTASRKNQENMTEEGHQLSIPCIAPQNLQNFSLTWTFTRSSESTVILRYDSRTRHTFNAWEGHAELDQDLVLLGDGSLLLHNPETEEHTGTYTCTFSGLQSRHTVQTQVNITVASISVVEQSGERSWWSTAASVAFVMFTIFVALLQCLRKGDTAIETRIASHRHNGAGLVDGGPDNLNTTASHKSGPHADDGNMLQLQFQTHGELGAEDCSVGPTPVTDIEQVGSAVLGNDGLQSYGRGNETFGSIDSRLNIPGNHAQDEAIRASSAPKGDTEGQQTVEGDDARTDPLHPRKDPPEGIVLNYIGQDLSCDISDSYTVETNISAQSFRLLGSQEEASYSSLPVK